MNDCIIIQVCVDET